MTILRNLTGNGAHPTKSDGQGCPSYETRGLAPGLDLGLGGDSASGLSGVWLLRWWGGGGVELEREGAFLGPERGKRWPIGRGGQELLEVRA